MQSVFTKAFSNSGSKIKKQTESLDALLEASADHSAFQPQSHPRAFKRPIIYGCEVPPTRLMIMAFAIGYLVVLLLVRHYSVRDPTSYFFDESQGYERRYSASRIIQAENYVAAVENGTLSVPARFKGRKPQMCVGIPATVRRAGPIYVRTAIGSLLESLTVDERRHLHLMLFIAHTDPTLHPAHDAPWTSTLPDSQLRYGEYDIGIDVDIIRQWEDRGAIEAKGLLDYAYILHACAATGAPHTLIVESDIVAARGWFAHTTSALAAIEGQAHAQRHGYRHPWVRNTVQPADYLYLRLFYTEIYLGWNVEFWPTYLSTSLSLAGGGLTALLLLRYKVPRLRPVVSYCNILAIIGAALPAVIALVFLAGRTTVFPLRPGIHRMDAFGCCSQALVFPRRRLPGLVHELTMHARMAGVAAGIPVPNTSTALEPASMAALVQPYIPMADMLFEHLAARHGWARWAAAPSAMQHVGTVSSKGGAAADAQAQRIWSFAFEMLPAEEGIRGLLPQT